MSHPESTISFENSGLEKLPVSDTGEIKNWLNNEAVGISPPVASYLDHLRNLINDEELRIIDQETVDDAYTLAHIIATKSQSRIGMTNGPIVEIHGIKPVHEVNGSDVFNAVREVDPTRQDKDAKSYHRSVEISMLHAGLMDLVQHELPESNREDW